MLSLTCKIYIFIKAFIFCSLIQFHGFSNIIRNSSIKYLSIIKKKEKTIFTLFWYYFNHLYNKQLCDLVEYQQVSVGIQKTYWCKEIHKPGFPAIWSDFAWVEIIRTQGNQLSSGTVSGKRRYIMCCCSSLKTKNQKLKLNLLPSLTYSETCLQQRARDV